MTLYQHPFLLAPWLSTDTSMPAQRSLYLAWGKLHADDLYRIVFHENPTMSFAQFVQFFSQPNVALQMCVDMTDETEPKLAGMVWLAEVSDLPGGRRATGSFVYFKEYQKPEWTDKFAEMTLRWWFEDIGVSTLCGMTPTPNRGAKWYSLRAGLKYVATLSNYTSFDGKICDAHVALMDRGMFEAKYGKVEAVVEA